MACADVSSMCELRPVTRSSDHFSSSSRSSGSTPSMSPITAIGSGAAMSRTKSHSPRSHTESISVSHKRTDRRHLVHDPLAGEAGVDELAPQQMCRIVHVDHVGHAGSLRPDSAGVGEQLRVALGVEHGLIARRGSQPVAVAEHRLMGPHPAVRLAGPAVGVEGAVGEVDVGLGGLKRLGHAISLASPKVISTLAAEPDTSARLGKPSASSSLAYGCSPRRMPTPPGR